jgi:hypothetical protein
MKIWYIIATVVIVAILGYWYFGSTNTLSPTATTQTSAGEQAQIPGLTAGNTTASISADLSQTPDTSAALTADAAASAQAVSGL